MTLSSSEILPHDIELIAEHGVPLDINPDFVFVHENGSLEFSDRGRRVYRLACLMSALSPDEELKVVRTIEDLRSLSLKVKRVRMMITADEVDRARQGGRVPARSRAIVYAALHGTFEDLCAAVAARLAAEEAGSNVIPVNFKQLHQ